MSLFNLDRFRFEKKAKKVEQENPPPPLPIAEIPAAPSAAAADSAAGGDDEVTDDSSRPDTPTSDVTEKTEDSSVPETPEAERTKNLSSFKNRRGIQFIDVSSDSEDQGPPNCSSTKQDSVSMSEVIVISEQSDDEEAEDVPPIFTYTNVADQLPDMDEEEDIRDAKLQTLKELFPQRSDQELLQLIESTSTMDEAIAAGLKFNDEAASRKRKLSQSPTNNSEDNGDQISKKQKKTL
uniref:CUE domain-containing protein n=2 Tax=Gopherus evgoodei TaxID=1825980 RepID=A0A8C4WD12_9SAUR